MHELLLGLVPGLPASLRDQILARAEGVPLYAVETVRMLLDRGLLVQEGSRYELVGEVETLEVPETLHALIAARLDGLAPEERRLLGDAAVLGKTFTPQALAALSGLGPARLDELLTGMVRREVLGLQSDPRSPEQGQYTFLQDLLRHVAYETLPKRERREKHLAAAEHLAATLGEDEVAEVIASHFLDAYRLEPDGPGAEALRGQAYDALVRAGERATSLGAAAEAQRYFEQAAELIPAPRQQAEALTRAGEMASRAGDPERAFSLFERAVGLYESVGDNHGAARASAWLGLAEHSLGRVEAAIERLEQVYAAIDDDAPDADVAMVALRLASAHFFAGNVERAAELTERGLDAAEALQLPDQLVRGWSIKAWIVSLRHPEEGRGLFQLAREFALAHENYASAGSACSNLSDLALQRDRYSESLSYLDEAVALAGRIGGRAGEWFALSEMSYALTMLGRWEEAFARFAELPEEQFGKTTNLIGPLSGILEIYLHRGRLQDARELFARFEQLAHSPDAQAEASYEAALAAVRVAEGNHSAALASAERAFASRDSQGVASQNIKFAFLHGLEAAVALGNVGKANELLETVEALPPGLSSPFLQATAHRFRGRLAGDDPGADRHFTAAAAQLRAVALPFYLAVVQLEHGEWLMARGRPDDARPLLAESRETFERLEAQPWLDRLDASASGATAEVLA
jgi:tetratricopeptide (TPR) repeat protein